MTPIQLSHMRFMADAAKQPLPDDVAAAKARIEKIRTPIAVTSFHGQSPRGVVKKGEIPCPPKGHPSCA